MRRKCCEYTQPIDNDTIILVWLKITGKVFDVSDQIFNFLVEFYMESFIFLRMYAKVFKARKNTLFADNDSKSDKNLEATLHHAHDPGAPRLFECISFHQSPSVPAQHMIQNNTLPSLYLQSAVAKITKRHLSAKFFV